MNLYAEDYNKADPFPHLVFMMDISELYDGFPDMTKARKFKTGNEAKSITDGSISHPLIDYLNSKDTIQMLEDITGIKGLQPDHNLIGGGFHETKRGGYLGIHTDFNIHRKTKLYRRVNLLIFLNEEWEDEWGGHLELWSKDGKECVAKIAPTFGTAVIFNTTKDSWHGHPTPLNTTERITRKSIAMYYYHKEPGAQITEPKNKISL